MIRRAEEEGRIKPGDTLIEATSGNTGIGLAMVAAIKGYKMILVMPESASVERRQVMKAYGADLHLVPAKASMEGAIDYARDLESKGVGIILDQFANPHNPEAHQLTTGPEIWEATEGKITHFVASTGTTGTIMGTGRYLKSQNPGVQIVGVIPAEGSKIPGIRKWPEAYQPKIYHPEELDQTLEVNQQEAEEMARRLAKEEGLFAGISSGGNVAAALRLAETVENSLIVVIICDRGDKYLSTGVFPA
jgi:cysteine synthase B